MTVLVEIYAIAKQSSISFFFLTNDKTVYDSTLALERKHFNINVEIEFFYMFQP